MTALNPLDITRSRSVSWIPPHFAKINLRYQIYDSQLEDWIKYKLKGRYFVLNQYDNHSTIVGFEDEKELTYFMLACPHFRRI